MSNVRRQEKELFVERIFTCPESGAAQVECERIAVQSGRGVVGDRNFGGSRHPGQNLTLVEAEEIEAFCGEQGRRQTYPLRAGTLSPGACDSTIS